MQEAAAEDGRLPVTVLILSDCWEPTEVLWGPLVVDLFYIFVLQIIE